jgi:hypothetical protein
LAHPGRLAQVGIDAGKPILNSISGLMGFVSFFDNFIQIIILLIAWLTGMFEIPAGGRRNRALERLVKQKRLSKAAPIPSIVRDPTIDASAEEDSLAENVQRVALHRVPRSNVRCSSKPSPVDADSRPSDTALDDAVEKLDIEAGKSGANHAGFDERHDQSTDRATDNRADPAPGWRAADEN